MGLVFSEPSPVGLVSSEKGPRRAPGPLPLVRNQSGPSPDSGRLCSDLGLAASGSGRERLAAHAQQGPARQQPEHRKAPSLLRCPPRGRRTPVSVDGAPAPAPPKASRELPKSHTQALDPVSQRCRGGPGSQVIPAVTEVSAAQGDPQPQGRWGDKGPRSWPLPNRPKALDTETGGKPGGREEEEEGRPSPGRAGAQTGPAVCHQGLGAPRGVVAGPEPRGAPRSASGAAVWPTSEGAANSNRLRFKTA